MRSKLLHNSGTAGACAGCDGITTAQKLSEGTQNFDIPSRPILSYPTSNRTPPYLGRGGRTKCTKMELFIWEISKEFWENPSTFPNEKPLKHSATGGSHRCHIYGIARCKVKNFHEIKEQSHAIKRDKSIDNTSQIYLLFPWRSSDFAFFCTILRNLNCDFPWIW